MSVFQIYKSSAGSGKTTALIQTFLKLSLSTDNAAQFKKILAVTFTNKAAAEMKDRLIEELDTISRLESSYDGSNFMVGLLLKDLAIDIETLARRAANMFKLVLHDYNDLSIGTIDQFNHRLIRSFSRDLNLKSDFEVELNEKELFAEAINRLLEKVGRDPFITDHLTAYTRFKLDDEKRANLNTDLAELHILVTSEEGIAALETLRKMERTDFGTAQKKLKELRDAGATAIRESGRAILDLLSANGVKPLELLGGKNGIGNFLIKTADFPEGSPNREAGYIQKSLNGNWAAKTSPQRDTIESLVPELTRLLNHIIETFETSGATYYVSEAILQKIDLIAILEELGKCVDEICEERNILPISRFNKIISDALRKEPVAFLYEHYGTRFNHILIDEYQDTSELQWFNILPLIDETLAKGKSSLVVGDAKQSIYRWRGGKAEQLIALPELIDAPSDLRAGIAENLMRTAETQILNTNYRSKPNIVKFNNAVFSHIGALGTQPHSLYSKEYLKNNVSQKWKDSTTDDGYVQIDYFGQKTEPETKSEKLVENVRKFKALGYSYRDMAVLIRSKKTGSLILEALQEAGIPASTPDSFEVDRDLHVKLIIALLRLTTDPDNSAAKIDVMRCLEQLKTIPFHPEKYLKKNARSGKNTIDLNRYFADNDLPNYKYISKSKGVFERTEGLIAAYLPGETNFYINGFLNILIANTGIHGSTYDFFEWWDSLETKPGVPERTDIDAVQLMTIHKSKGLQFKVVFVPDVTWLKRANNQSLKWFDLHKFPDLPLPYAPLALNKNLIEQGLSEEWEADEMANDFDNLNLIYVALTRAIDALCIGFDKGSKDTRDHEGGLNHTGYWLTKAVENIEVNARSEFGTFVKEIFDDESFCLKIGAIPKAATAKKEINHSGDIEWVTYNTASWTENVRIAPIVQSTEQVRGIWFHRIVSITESVADIAPELEKLEKSGELNTTEIEKLRRLLHTLYSDPKFLDLKKNSKILAERELFYRDKILRPDLVFESEDQLSVIDFKTGTEEAEHIQQVSQYADALREISSKPIYAFLLYTEPYHWKRIGVSDTGQASLF